MNRFEFFGDKEVDALMCAIETAFGERPVGNITPETRSYLHRLRGDMIDDVVQRAKIKAEKEMLP